MNFRKIVYKLYVYMQYTFI